MHKVRINIRAKEIDTLSKTLIELYNNDEAANKNDFIRKTFAKISELSQNITEAITHGKPTSQLSELDKTRNEAIKRLGKVLDGYKSSPIEELAQPALRLMCTFDKYGTNMIYNSFHEKSSMIKSLLTDFETEQRRNDAALLPGVNECLRLLSDAEKEFKSASANYSFGLYAARKRKNATNYRRDLLDVINKELILYLNSNIIVQINGLCSFAANISNCVEDINAKIKLRTNKKADNVQADTNGSMESEDHDETIVIALRAATSDTDNQ